MSQRQWLVKSNGQILGPYSQEEVNKHLLNQELSIRDEVAPAMGSWKLLRDQEEFSHITNQLIDAEASLLENTQVLKSDTGEMTRTPTHVLKEESLDQTLVSSNDIKAPEAEYFYDGDSKYKDSFKLPLMAMSLIIILIFGGTLYIKIFSISEKKLERYRVLLMEGSDLIDQGNFDEALTKYIAAYQIDSRTSDFHTYLGALWVHAGETVQARRLLEDGFVDVPEIKEEVELVLGLADLVDENYKSAQERFEKISSPQLSTSVVLNKSLSLIQTGKYSEAHELLLIHRDTPSPLLFLLLAETRIHLWNESADKNHLMESFSDLRNYISSESSYYQESLLVQAYLYSLFEDKEKMTFQVVEMLNVDPYQTKSFKKNIFTLHSVIDSSFWRNWCSPIIASSVVEGVHQMLKAYCDFKNEKQELALKSIRSVVEQKTTDPLALSLYAFMLNESDHKDQALVEINKALEIDPRHRLALSLKGYICEQKQAPCALEAWSQLVEIDDRSLAGHSGLSKYYLLKGETQKAVDSYKKGYLINNQYVPLLQLENQLKR